MKKELKLENEQLQALNSHLIEKNRSLEAELVRRNGYIADLSHRMRTPLSAVLGMTSLARGAENDQRLISDCLDKIDFSAHMLLNTINEILELDAVRKGNLVIHNACFNFKLLISAISSMCNTECNNKDICYDVTLNGVTEESIVGDSTQLNRALMILLMRAVKVTAPGGHVKFLISQRDITKSLVQIQFSIIDNGIALTQEQIDEINNPDGNSDIHLVKELVALMNGNFAFESKNSIGTIFTLTIPFGINTAASIITQELFESYRVLLVTNDKQTMDSVSEVLRRIGTECVFAEDSKQATVALLEASTLNKDFNLCLVDWGASAADGIEKTKEIRKSGTPKLKIAAITVSDTAELQFTARMAGADKMLPKPLFQSTVFNLMMELTGREYTKLTAKPGDFDFTGCRVLFAEDNELSAQITAAQLNAVGISSDRAENGTDCLEVLKFAKINYYELVLLDMKMPYMDGCETAKAIRSMNRYGIEGIPIIALTADALSSDITSAYEAGMNDYIVKPIDTFQLYSTLAKYMKKKD